MKYDIFIKNPVLLIGLTKKIVKRGNLGMKNN